MGLRVSLFSLSRVTLRTTAALALTSATVALVDCAGGPRHVELGADDAAFGTFSSSEASTYDRPCEGLECSVVECAPGEETSLDGRVLAPNGTLPISGALVYVGASGAPEIPTGVSCQTCATLLPQRPVAVAISQADGSFSLRGVPIGKDIPVVIQVGKWRRTVVVPEVERCTRKQLPDELTRLPRNRREGEMPRIALTTGVCDDIGCLLPKLGIDPTEIGAATEGDTKSVHVYRGAMAEGDAPRGAPPATMLWSDGAKLGQYDMLLLSCECGERLENKGPAANAAMLRYLDAGGRIFTTDFMYSWYRDAPSSDLHRVIDISGGGHEGGRPVLVGKSTPHGTDLLKWLRATSTGGPELLDGQLDFESVFDNIASVDTTRAKVWATSSRPNAPSSAFGARVLSIDFPLSAAADKQCGRAVHFDAHVNQPRDGDRVGPDFPATCAPTMSPGEAALAYFLFHLASCVAPPPEKIGVAPQR